MLTLRTLKELIDTPKRGEKLPTPKQLRTGESPVVAHKTTGAGVNEVHIIVYQSGYAVYGIGNRATVFPVNLELGYGYSSVTEKKRKEDEMADQDGLLLRALQYEEGHPRRSGHILKVLALANSSAR